MSLKLPSDFAKKIAETLNWSRVTVDEFLEFTEDKEGYFWATLRPKKNLDKPDFITLCRLTRDLGGEDYVKGARGWKIPGPMAKKGPTAPKASSGSPLPGTIKAPGQTTAQTHGSSESIPKGKGKISQSSELCISALSEDEDVQALRGSQKKIGPLYPVLVNPVGEVIDGFHRLKADPNWPTFTVEGIADPLQLARARLIANERRNVTAEERAQLLREIYAYSQWTPKQMAEELGWSLRKVYLYLPDDLKGAEPEELARARLARGMDKTESSATLKTQDLTEGKIREILDSPKGREVVASMLHEQGLPTLPEQPEESGESEEEPLYADHIETTEGQEEPEEGPTKETKAVPEHVHRKIEGMQVGQFRCPECKKLFFIDHISASDHRLTFVDEEEAPK